MDYKKLADAGRNGDTQLAHVTPGEMMIPPEALENDPELKEKIFQSLREMGVDPEAYIAGGGEVSINPETGMPEFGFFKSLKKLVKKAAPFAGIAASFIPGLQPLAAVGIGAAGGALSGGGLKGALLGGASAGLGKVLSGSSLFGTAAGTPLSGGFQGPTQGSGILGSITRSVPKLSGVLSGASGGGNVSSFGKSALSNVLSGGIGYKGNKDAEEELLKAQKARLAAYAPFQNQKFTPGDLTQDPGYQFRLSQGNQALDRSQSARGNLFSGQALKEAQDYGQGLADSTYNEAFQRWMNENGFNLGVADRQAGVFDDIGNVRANATINNSNLLSRGLSGILGGSGYMNTGAGFDQDELRRMLGYA